MEADCDSGSGSNARVLVPLADRRVFRCLQVMKEGKAENYLKSQQTQRMTFSYDAVFGPGVQQAAVYAQTAAPMIEHVIRGKNATVFAYGATGAGKTHTVRWAHSATLVKDHLRSSCYVFSTPLTFSWVFVHHAASYCQVW